MTMDLFDNDPTRNLLPRDGTVNYFGRVFGYTEVQHYLSALLEEIPWVNDEARIFGKRIITARKVAWYGDEAYAYSYSGTTKLALPWNEVLLAIKSVVEKIAEVHFNSCLLNLYQDGGQGMAWHSDDERTLGKDTIIASVSFGAERKFALKHKRAPLATSVILEAGSLLIMKGSTQTNWQHCIPKSKRILLPRVNLTFRTIVSQ